jgi:hypothetical protein
MTITDMLDVLVLADLVAHIRAWGQPPPGYPDEHELYYRDDHRGWYYLTEEGRRLRREHLTACQRQEEIYAAQVERWAHKSAQRTRRTVAAM